MDNTKNKTTRYLQTFFAEKRLPFVQWELTSNDGTFHIISNEVVVGNIYAAHISEQVQIANMIRRIDFLNGDVNDYLKHLATALIN